MKLVCNSCDGKYNSVDIRFTKSCDNKCPFCIESTGLHSLGKTRVDKIVQSTIQTKVKDILILGGEPMLVPDKVHQYITAIRNRPDGDEYKIYLTTSLPNTFNTSILVDEIISMLDGLNVSIQHYDSNINNTILNASSLHDRIELLRQLNLKHADKIRTSINLSKGGIDTKEELVRCIETLKTIGCKYIKINELQNAPDVYVSFEDILNVKLPSPYSQGCQRVVDSKLICDNLDGVTILLKRSCFRVENTRKASFTDLIKTITKLFYRKKNIFRVIYENGQLNNNWIKK